MKYVLGLAATLALFGAATLPALAGQSLCVITTNHVTNSILPPICLVSDSKENHPDWYRDGGYCAGGANTAEVTASSNSEDCAV